MATIPARELRNNVSEVLRRVEAGERLRITVSGRPVAELRPLDDRPMAMSREEFLAMPKADRGLLDELKADEEEDMKLEEEKYARWWGW